MSSKVSEVVGKLLKILDNETLVIERTGLVKSPGSILGKWTNTVVIGGASFSTGSAKQRLSMQYVVTDHRSRHG